ncbi:hypothetical protein DN41_3247 [Vibrio cholerae]|nr:hypothetical protein DN41_3247 [Vibrio cholerae]GHZ64403.1 hypothetical protein VCSRO80_3382 [Vibrio cholerae]
MLGAVHRLDHKGLDLGLVLAQVLHLAVVDVVGPLAIGIDGQSAQRTGTRGAVARHELGLIGAVHIGHGQDSGIGQYIWAGIFSHSADVVTRDDGCIIDGYNSSGNTTCRAVHTIGDGVVKRDITIEIWGWRKDHLTIAQGDGPIVDRYRTAFGNVLAVDSGNGEAIAIRIRVVAQHINGDGAVLRHGKLVVTRQRHGIHHAVVSPLGRGVAHRVGQGCIHGDGAVDRQIRGGDGQGDLGTANVVSRQSSASVRHTITVPVHLETIASLGIVRQPDDDIHPIFALIGGDDIVHAVLDFDLRCRGGGTVNTAIVGRGAGVAGRIGHSRGDGIRAFSQRGGDIHAVTAVRLYGGGQGLLVTVGIGHDQGNGTARRGIRRTSNGRGGVVGVVWGINSYN